MDKIFIKFCVIFYVCRLCYKYISRYLLLVLVGNYLVLAVAAQVINRHDISCKPHVVWFSGTPSALNVDLNLINVPERKHLDYSVRAYSKTGNQYTPVKNIISGMQVIRNVHIDGNVYDTWDKLYIGYCKYNQKQAGCNLGRDRVHEVILLRHSKAPTNSDCTDNANCVLTLDLEKDCNVQTPPPWMGYSDVPVLYLRDLGTGQHESKIILKCSVVAQKFDLLSLYQRQSTGSPVLLKIVQHLEDEKGVTKLAVSKTLINSDVDSEMYCVKERPDHTYKESNVETLRLGDFKYRSPEDADDARVIVEPATTIARFSRDKPLSLVCSGTTPVDGRSLTWYIRDINTSEIEVADPSSQHYDREANENKLMLKLNESYDSKTLFCAQDRHLVVEHVGGRRSVKRYAEVAASRNIELIHEKQKSNEKMEDDAPEGSGSSGPDIGLVCGLVAGLVVLLAVVAVAGHRLRRGKAGAGGGPEENIYASPEELTYAVLNLPESGALVKTTTTSPYAQIVGVYNPRN